MMSMRSIGDIGTRNWPRMKWTVFIYFLCSLHSLSIESTPLSCSVSTVDSCPALLYYVSNSGQSLQQITDTFSVKQGSVTRYDKGANIYLINVSCSCDHNSNDFFAKTSYIVKEGDTWEGILTSFNGLALEERQIDLIPLQVLEIKLQCGCLDSIEVMSYRIVRRDTLWQLETKFNSSLNQIVKLNNITDPNMIFVGDLLYLPLSRLIEDPKYLVSAGEISSTFGNRSGRRFHTGLFMGVLGTLVILVAAMVSGMFYMRSKRMKCSERMSDSKEILSSYDFESGRKCKAPKSLFCSFPSVSSKNSECINKYERAFSMAKATGFESEKPIVFMYDEILAATDNFGESKKIGKGSYGSVYLGNLRDKEVAIKQMINTKSKEFLAELKVLCKVHHTNLVELIGYSVGGEHLFLIYEFAKNGALSDHLHDPITKGYQPLSWISRVQIALDSAKGLEYIHENTKPRFIHRDVKTSNILLDVDLRAKIADFGLAKLSEHSTEGGMMTGVVGTFGYLAPEYVRDGHATTKSDVYAFGVVLMELITGQEALRKSATGWQSLVSLMLSILKDEDWTNSFKSIIDRNLMGYHEDSIVQMAQLSNACVEKDPNLRPGMTNIVFVLSQILFSSIEWEVGEARNSHMFSGIFQAR